MPELTGGIPKETDFSPFHSSFSQLKSHQGWHLLLKVDSSSKVSKIYGANTFNRDAVT